MTESPSVIAKHWDFLQSNAEKDVLTEYGGSASGKTYTILQYIAAKFLTENNFEAVICRKYRPTLKLTLLKDMISILRTFGVWESVEYNRSELTMSVGTNHLYFIPLIEPERIKGIDVDIIYIDEINEIDEDIFNQLMLRYGRSADHKHALMICSFNPVSADHWCYRELVQTAYPNRASLHSTHRDNPYLSQKFRNRVREYKNIDDNFYRVYCLGLPGSMTGLIYTSNWEVKDTDIKDFDCFGIDWGWTHPLSIVGCKRTGDREFTFRQLYYASEKLIEADVIPWMKEHAAEYGFDKKLIYPDTANPEYNKLLELAGFRLGKTNKDVMSGINYLRGHHLVFTADSIDLIKEIKVYRWKVDKDGKETDEPVKIMDDGMDSCRYAAVSHFMIEKRMAKPILISGGGIE